MSFMRQCIADRAGGGVIAVLTAFLLFVQAFVGSLTCGATIAAGAGNDGLVICTQDGTSTVQAGPDGAPPDPVPEQDCPCAVFCQLGCQVLAAAPNGSVGTAEPRPADGGTRPAVVETAAFPKADGLVPEARGPPSLFG